MRSGGYSAGLPFTPAQFAKIQDEPERVALLGEKFEKNGLTYRLVQVHTVCIADVIASAAVLYFVSANVVTNDVSESATGDEDSFAGIAPALTVSVPESTATATYYMLMQEPVKGDFATVKTNGDDDIAAGDYVIAEGDGVCNSYLVDPANATAPSDAELQALQANVSGRLIGVAMAADDNTLDTVLVKFV
jgi:hypothetical protein